MYLFDQSTRSIQLCKMYMISLPMTTNLQMQTSMGDGNLIKVIKSYIMFIFIVIFHDQRTHCHFTSDI